jgi:hypothetical protein
MVRAVDGFCEDVMAGAGVLNARSDKAQVSGTCEWWMVNVIVCGKDTDLGGEAGTLYEFLETGRTRTRRASTQLIREWRSHTRESSTHKHGKREAFTRALAWPPPLPLPIRQHLQVAACLASTGIVDMSTHVLSKTCRRRALDVGLVERSQTGYRLFGSRLWILQTPAGPPSV